MLSPTFTTNLLRWKGDELDCCDQVGIDIIRIFWFAAARNSHREFSVRRNVTNFFERRRLLGITPLRKNQQETHNAP